MESTLCCEVEYDSDGLTCGSSSRSYICENCIFFKIITQRQGNDEDGQLPASGLFLEQVQKYCTDVAGHVPSVSWDSMLQLSRST
ncbi:hypothetical protein SLA2020_103360 [Shorea laevis]